VWATAGLWLGTSIAVAGANVGRGDTIWTTIGPLVLAVVGLLVLLAVFAATGGLAAATLDRDVPSGMRVAGLLVAWGIVLGRSVAGDWESVRDTWRDYFVRGAPTLVLLVAGVLSEWLLRPNVRRPMPSAAAGVVPAAAYMAAAVAWVAWLGRP
jgi:hypothetical protein